MSSKHSFIQRKVIDLFSLNTANASSKGWIVGPACPFCGNKGKFAIKLNDTSKSKFRNHISFNCFKGSCQSTGSEYQLLKQVGQEHLLSHGEFIGETEKVENNLILNQQDEEINLTTPTLHKPLGYRRISHSEYLEGRGFQDWQYDQYHIGISKLDPKLRDRVIFLITEDGENKGYVARTTLSSKAIEAYHKRTGITIPKFRNEQGADFSKLIFGIDDITEGTTDFILVEGPTDKANVDKELKLNQQVKVKCGCTFGKKLSEIQLAKLAVRGIKNFILMYDPDAINQSKKYSYLIQSWGLSVKVGYLSSKDPGELKESELRAVLNNLQSPENFSLNVVQKRKLE